MLQHYALLFIRKGFHNFHMLPKSRLVAESEETQHARLEHARLEHARFEHLRSYRERRIAAQSSGEREARNSLRS